MVLLPHPQVKLEHLTRSKSGLGSLAILGYGAYPGQQCCIYGHPSSTPGTSEEDRGQELEAPQQTDQTSEPLRQGTGDLV